MASTSWPDPTSNNLVTDLQYEQIASPPASGVIGTPSDTSFAYADSGGLYVKIRANKLARLRGHAYSSGGADIQMNLAPNASGNPRIDTLVLRYDRGTGKVSEAMRQGTPAAPGTQVPPTLTQQTGSSGVYELPILDVDVANGASTTGPGNVRTREVYLAPDGSLTCLLTTTRPTGVPDGTMLFVEGTVNGKAVRRRFRWDRTLNAGAGGWRIMRQTWWSIVLGPGSAAGTRLPNGTSVPGSGGSFAAVYTPTAIPIEPGCEWLITYSMPLNCAAGSARFLTRLRDGASPLARAEVVQQNAASDFVRAEVAQFPWVPPVGQTSIAPVFDATELGGKTFDAYADPASPFWLVLEATGIMAAEVQTAP